MARVKYVELAMTAKEHDHCPADDGGALVLSGH